MEIFRDRSEIDTSKYIIAKYHVNFHPHKASLRDVAWNIAIGQSVGNPSIRNKWETEEMFEDHSCLVLSMRVGESDYCSTHTGNWDSVCEIAYPLANIDLATDGVAHLLCQLMGGHVDIDIIERCRLVEIQFPEDAKKHFLGPKYGISGIREFTKQKNKPILGGIVKPKVGITPSILVEMTKQMVDGGVDFIKEDEIMSNPHIAPLEKRVEAVANYLAKQKRKVIFCHTINCDPHLVADRVRTVHECGGNGVHINVYSGLGVYNSIRKLDYPLFLHFQSSGLAALTNEDNRYSISWNVIAQLASMMGVDTIQSGMIGGYSDTNESELLERLEILRNGNSLPALSCGMHPGIVQHVTNTVGNDYLANVGGAIHGHPQGSKAGAKAMRQAINKTYGKEYGIAINKWGIKI